MFTVQNISGQFIPYTKGIIRLKRGIENVQALSPGHEIKEAVAGEVRDKSNVNVENHLKSYQEAPHQNSPRQRLILAKDLMSTPVMTIQPDTSLAAAWKLIIAKRHRHLLITSSNKKLIGLLSDRDILKSLAMGDETDPITTPVSKIMHTDILTAAPDTEIREIAKVLFEERIGCMPILTAEKELTGIITRSDILRALLVHAPLELWI